jgi:predicted transcriptional regulator
LIVICTSQEKESRMTITLPISTLLRTNTTIRDLFVYLYELSPLDVDLLFILIKKGNKRPMTLEQLSEISKRKKTTVFASMKKLVSLRLCNRTMQTKKEGGYFYIYTAISMEELKTETLNRVRELEQSINKLMKTFESHIQRTIKTFYEET